MVMNKLFYLDSYLNKCNARVIQRTQIDKKPAVLLDRTVFYPTSGGQMHDCGTIEDVHVTDVILRDDQIWHIVEREITKEDVVCVLDWPRRFDFMQQHTGFHILAQSFLRILQVDTLSSHLGEQCSTIDVNVAGLSAEDVLKVENFANSIVWENRKVKCFFIQEKEVAQYSLRKAPEKMNPIRIVQIQDFDCDPCGGTHVNSTGEVGMIKILSNEKIRGTLRFTFVAGQRALRQFQKQHSMLSGLSNVLTTGFDDMQPMVEKMMEEVKKLRKEVQSYQNSAAEQIISELLQRSRSEKVVMQLMPNAKMETLRRLASMAVKQSPGTFLLGADGETPALVFATGDPDLDLRPVLQRVIGEIDGRGGGDKNFVQGGGKKSEGVVTALDRAVEILTKSKG